MLVAAINRRPQIGAGALRPESFARTGEAI